MVKPKRIIGTYTGEHKGPLLVAFGGMHGNEVAGVEALELVFRILEMELVTNPAFSFSGRFLGVKGNVRALEAGKRYIDKDLNRQWSAANVHRINQSAPEDLDAEDREMLEILSLIQHEIESYRPEKMVVLDLHTTSAFGGIFTIVNDDPESLAIGVELHAPVVKGLIRGIRGTTLHYFTDEHFPLRTIAVSFEAGQHEEYLSINRSIAAIINCMRTIGCVKPFDVENRHDRLLIEFSKGLPKVNDLLIKHSIVDPGRFQLIPGLKNFQRVRKGQLLGQDGNGEILAPVSGLLLMPKYQEQGDDGFFIITEV